MQTVESRHIGLEGPFLKKDYREMAFWFMKLMNRQNDL